MITDEPIHLDEERTDPGGESDPAHPADDLSAPGVRPRPAYVEQFIGVIRAGPANGSGADYSDARYYIDRGVLKPALKPGDAVAADVDAIPGVKQTVTATNLAELADKTHTLPAGTVVQVFALYTRGNGAAKLYAFNLPARQPAVVVRISGPAAGAGEYNGAILTGASTASPGGALAMPAGMSAPGGDDALVLNVEEDAISGHRLLAGSYAVGVIRGQTNETPSRKIVVIRGGVGRLDSPTSMGISTEGSESSDSTSWTRAASGTPVTVYVASRTVYNETGDKTLYSFVRQLTFDARGLLTAIGSETRVTVDVTEACS